MRGDRGTLRILVFAAAAVLAVGTGMAASSPATKFGVMLSAPGMSVDRRIAIARELGARVIRPRGVLVPGWRGPDPEVEAFSRAGFGIVLTVLNAPARGTPSLPPADLRAYERSLGAILDTHAPELLVVENEENSALFYRGTPEEYGAQLRAACRVAHSRGVRCTNGGLVSTLVALLVYDGYLTSGRADRAKAFAIRAFEPELRQSLNSPKVREQVQRGRALIAQYRDARIDFLNIHWYIPDAQALEEAVNYMRQQVGVPVITNEIGQRNDDPRVTTALLTAVTKLGLPYAVWFSVDIGRARALMNPDGSLRPTGVAFRDFMMKIAPRGERRR